MPAHPRGLLRTILFTSLWGLTESFGAPSSIETMLDDKSITRSRTEIHVPYTTGQILFRVGDPPLSTNKNARRVRYKFDGLDSEWKQRSGYMVFSVRFYNASGDQVSQEEFKASGESPGWNHTIEKSTFTSRHESLTVPEHAERVCIFISSAGPPNSIGAYVVSDVVVSKVNATGTPEVILESATFLKLGNATPLSSLWIPDGSHPTMASIIKFPGSSEPRQAFAIIDDDPISHAEWHFIKEQSPKVVPGEKLSVEWKELYNIGPGDLFDTAYAKPNEGRYRFHTEELDTFGVPTGAGDWVDIVVQAPYWKTGWFLAAAASTLVIVITGGVYVLVHAIVNRRLRRLQQEHMLELERLRIARNIHDDLGARLTQISLVSALAAKESFPENAPDNFNKITRMTRDLVAALYETVWTVDPENDHLDSLVSFLCQLIPNMCEPAGIRCRLDTDDVPNDVHVSSETRHNVSLIVKEAVHNAVKYSSATEIQTQITYTPPLLSILIKDNGRGFRVEENMKPTPGKPDRLHGLTNMQNRIKAIGGKLTIHSVLNEGTSISFSVSI